MFSNSVKTVGDLINCAENYQVLFNGSMFFCFGDESLNTDLYKYVEMMCMKYGMPVQDGATIADLLSYAKYWNNFIRFAIIDSLNLHAIKFNNQWFTAPCILADGTHIEVFPTRIYDQAGNQYQPTAYMYKINTMPYTDPIPVCTCLANHIDLIGRNYTPIVVGDYYSIYKHNNLEDYLAIDTGRYERPIAVKYSESYQVSPDNVLNYIGSYNRNIQYRGVLLGELGEADITPEEKDSGVNYCVVGVFDIVDTIHAISIY